MLCQQLHIRQILDDVHLGFGLLPHAQRVEHIGDDHAERLILGTDCLRDIVLEYLNAVQHIVTMLFLAPFTLQRRLIEIWLLILAHSGGKLGVASDSDFYGEIFIKIRYVLY